MQAIDLLVERAQSGDRAEREEAFSQLIAQFENAAHAWAYRMLGDTHLAQDAVQDAFITAYHRIDQLREPAAFPAWLKRIVMTHCNRLERRKSSHWMPLDEDDPGMQGDTDADFAANADPAATMEERDLKEQVTRAVRALPEHERVVTELFYITGYSQQEIAEQLELPLTTVKKRLQYAREHLRETMMPTSQLTFSAGSSVDDAMLRFLAWIAPELLAVA